MTVKIYTTPYCPYCVRAKMLLDRKEITYEEIDVTSDWELRGDLMNRTGRTSVPQIFFGTIHVGGCDELHELDRKGELEALLEQGLAD